MKIKITDKQRLDFIIEHWETIISNSDFEQALFFEREKTQTENSAFRHAIDQMIKNGY